MVAPLTPDGARLAAIREALPAVGAGIYLNTAAAGPLPAETARVMADEAAREATLGRAHPADADETMERVAEARAAMGAVLASDLDSVALTRGTAHGLDLVAAAIPFGRGHRAIFLTDRTGHGPWPVARLRTLGVEVVELLTEGWEAATLAAIEAALRPGTMLIGVSHVLEASGEILPVAQISDLAHPVAAIVAVDASQSVGAIPVSPGELHADAIAFPSERWLLGPTGLGGLWCEPRFLRERMAALHPAGFADPLSSAGGRGRQGLTDPGLPPWHRPSVAGYARSCGLLSMQIGLTWAWERAGSLARQAAAGLRSIDGVDVLTPEDRIGTIVSFRIGGWAAGPALEELGARIFAIAGLVQPLDAIRISPGAWNTEEEINRFVAGVALLAAHTPEALPPRRSLSVLE